MKTAEINDNIFCYSWTPFIAPSKIAFPPKIASFFEWPTSYLVNYLQKLRPSKISLPRKLRQTFSVKLANFWWILKDFINSFELDRGKDIHQFQVMTLEQKEFSWLMFWMLKISSFQMDG